MAERLEPTLAVKPHETYTATGWSPTSLWHMGQALPECHLPYVPGLNLELTQRNVDLTGQSRAIGGTCNASSKAWVPQSLGPDPKPEAAGTTVAPQPSQPSDARFASIGPVESHEQRESQSPLLVCLCNTLVISRAA